MTSSCIVEQNTLTIMKKAQVCVCVGGGGGGYAEGGCRNTFFSQT